MTAFQVAILAALAAPMCSLAATNTDADGSNGKPSFAAFVSTYGRAYAKDTHEYEQRRILFEERLEQVQHQNSKPHRRWNAVVNHLSDRTEAELLQLRGLRVMKADDKARRPAGVIGAHLKGQFLGQIKSAVLPEEKSWTHLKTAQLDIDQSACGSCWAIAAATMLQANAEINGYNRTFSPQELVSCVPNPHNCGGSGGCDGSTVELAMNWVVDEGLETEKATPYFGGNGVCQKSAGASLISHDDGGNLADMIAVGFHAASGASAGASLGLKGWERLAENEYEPLMTAVAETGPVAVSVSAGPWSGYGGGIFDSCNKDAVIDHAVTLVGYGVDKARNDKYWIIKNSWGLGWGENGNIRMLREEGNVHCGTDNQPKVGTGCDGGPSSVHVCGMCGILYDSVVAHFKKA